MSTDDRPHLDIDLSGPAGNAYAVLAIVRKACRDLLWSSAETEALMKEMMAGNYEHLLATARKHFNIPDIEDADDDE